MLVKPVHLLCVSIWAGASIAGPFGVLLRRDDPKTSPSGTTSVSYFLTSVPIVISGPSTTGPDASQSTDAGVGAGADSTPTTSDQTDDVNPTGEPSSEPSSQYPTSSTSSHPVVQDPSVNPSSVPPSQGPTSSTSSQPDTQTSTGNPSSEGPTGETSTQPESQAPSEVPSSEPTSQGSTLSTSSRPMVQTSTGDASSQLSSETPTSQSSSEVPVVIGGSSQTSEGQSTSASPTEQSTPANSLPAQTTYKPSTAASTSNAAETTPATTKPATSSTSAAANMATSVESWSSEVAAATSAIEKFRDDPDDDNANLVLVAIKNTRKDPPTVDSDDSVKKIKDKLKDVEHDITDALNKGGPPAFNTAATSVGGALGGITGLLGSLPSGGGSTNNNPDDPDQDDNNNDDNTSSTESTTSESTTTTSSSSSTSPESCELRTETTDIPVTIIPADIWASPSGSLAESTTIDFDALGDPFTRPPPISTGSGESAGLVVSEGTPGSGGSLTSVAPGGSLGPLGPGAAGGSGSSSGAVVPAGSSSGPASTSATPTSSEAESPGYTSSTSTDSETPEETSTSTESQSSGATSSSQPAVSTSGSSIVPSTSNPPASSTANPTSAAASFASDFLNIVTGVLPDILGPHATTGYVINSATTSSSSGRILSWDSQTVQIEGTRTETMPAGPTKSLLPDVDDVSTHGLSAMCSTMHSSLCDEAVVEFTQGNFGTDILGEKTARYKKLTKDVATEKCIVQYYCDTDIHYDLFEMTGNQVYDMYWQEKDKGEFGTCAKIKFGKDCYIKADFCADCNAWNDIPKP